MTSIEDRQQNALGFGASLCTVLVKLQYLATFSVYCYLFSYMFGCLL